MKYAIQSSQNSIIDWTFRKWTSSFISMTISSWYTQKFQNVFMFGSQSNQLEHFSLVGISDYLFFTIQTDGFQLFMLSFFSAGTIQFVSISGPFLLEHVKWEGINWLSHSPAKTTFQSQHRLLLLLPTILDKQMSRLASNTKVYGHQLWLLKRSSYYYCLYHTNMNEKNEKKELRSNEELQEMAFHRCDLCNFIEFLGLSLAPSRSTVEDKWKLIAHRTCRKMRMRPSRYVIPF